MKDQELKSDLFIEWNSEKNKDIDFTKLSRGSNIKVWWKCKYGHEWQATMHNRSKGQGCPICSNKIVLHGYNDLFTLHPELSMYWDFDSNTIDPKSVTAGSDKEVVWKCEKGHFWRERIYSMVNKKGKCPYCEHRVLLTGFNDLLTEAPHLADEWNYDKNKCDPSEVLYKRKNRYWWKCSKCGYEWLATIGSMERENRCPSCSNRALNIGVNDISTLFPQFVQEWDTVRNKSDSTHTIAKKDTNYWWKCKNGHSYKSTISKRLRGDGCPICSNRKIIKGVNSLEDLYPQIAKEWNYEKNNCLPSEISGGTARKYWWKCKEGHEWLASVNQRTKQNTGCPYCSGRLCISGINDLLSIVPEVAKEWDYEKNYPLIPSDIAYSSSKKVWWKCKYGHEWQATVNNRTGNSKTGCPICSNRTIRVGENDLVTTNPEVISEWNYDRNTDIKPTDFVAGSAKSVWWKCDICGHEYKTSIRNKVSGRMCPKCDLRLHTSFPEQVILYYVQKTNPGAVSRFKDLFPNGMELDIYVPDKRIGIEYDGIAWHNSKTVLRREAKKYSLCKENNIFLIRVKEEGKSEEIANCDVQIVVSRHPSYTELTKVMNQLSEYINIPTEIDIDKDRVTIETRYKTSLREASLPSMFPELMNEWDYEKNGNLNPEILSTGTIRKVWWKCKNGHSWQSSIANRTIKKTSCPYCAGQRAITGVNDLKTVFPQIAQEWDYEKNGDLLPENVLAYSSKKVWWKCSKGHSWKVSISNRSHGNGCPYCAGFYRTEGVNDLATLRPDIAQKWDYQKNTIKPTQVSVTSNKKVWWICKNGHSFESTISRMTIGKGNCPYCINQKVLKGYNDLETKYPEVVNRWNYKKNTIKPDSVVPGSNKKVWWICPNCGHEYQNSVAAEVKRQKCHVCGIGYINNLKK